jgi:hypothetical protein
VPSRGRGGATEPTDDSDEDVVTELVDLPVSTDPVGDEPQATRARADSASSRRIGTRWLTSCWTI